MADVNPGQACDSGLGYPGKEGWVMCSAARSPVWASFPRLPLTVLCLVVACQPQGTPAPTGPSCAEDYECPSGQICRGGACQDGCRADYDCQSNYCNPTTLSCDRPDAAFPVGNQTIAPLGPGAVWTRVPVERPGGSLREPDRSQPKRLTATPTGFLLEIEPEEYGTSSDACPVLTLDPTGHYAPSGSHLCTSFEAPPDLRVWDGRCTEAFSSGWTYEQPRADDCSDARTTGVDTRVVLLERATALRVPHRDQWLLAWTDAGAHMAVRSGSGSAPVALVPESATSLHIRPVDDTAHVAAVLDGQLIYQTWEVLAGTTTAAQVLQLPYNVRAIHSLSQFGEGALVVLEADDADHAILLDSVTGAHEVAAPWGSSRLGAGALAQTPSGVFAVWLDGNAARLAHWSPLGVNSQPWPGSPLHAPVVGCRTSGCLLADSQTLPSISPSTWHVGHDLSVSEINQDFGPPDSEGYPRVVPVQAGNWIGWTANAAVYVRLLGHEGAWRTGPILLESERSWLWGGRARNDDHVEWVWGSGGQLRTATVSPTGDVLSLDALDIPNLGSGPYTLGFHGETCLFQTWNNDSSQAHIFGLEPLRLIRVTEYPPMTMGWLVDGLHVTSTALSPETRHDVWWSLDGTRLAEKMRPGYIWTVPDYAAHTTGGDMLFAVSLGANTEHWTLHAQLIGQPGSSENHELPLTIPRFWWLKLEEASWSSAGWSVWFHVSHYYEAEPDVIAQIRGDFRALFSPDLTHLILLEPVTELLAKSSFNEATGHDTVLSWESGTAGEFSLVPWDVVLPSTDAPEPAPQRPAPFDDQMRALSCGCVGWNGTSRHGGAVLLLAIGLLTAPWRRKFFHRRQSGDS